MESVDVVIGPGVISDQGTRSNVDVVMGPVEETHRKLDSDEYRHQSQVTTRADNNNHIGLPLTF